MEHWLEITFIALHVLGATVWVGSTVALTLIAVPAIRLLSGESRATALRSLGQRWRPIGWGSLLLMVATGVPLAAHVLPGGGTGAKVVFAVKMAGFAILICLAYAHDFVLGPRVAREIREGLPQVSRPLLVRVGWASFTLTVSMPILGVVLAEIA